MGTLNQALDELVQKQKVWHERKSAVWGTSTGYPSIDAFTGGFEAGKVFVLGARTSHGKTALATSMAFHVATERLLNNEPGQVLIFSPEMAAYMIGLRQACAMSGVPMNTIRQGSATEAELEAWFEAIEMMRILDPYIVIEAQDEPSIQDMMNRVEVKARTEKDKPVALVVIDYLQYLTSQTGNDSYHVISEIARQVKSLANRVNVPILLLSQLNRDAAKKNEIPDLHDLEGSGKIEARADVVALLWRPEGNETGTGEAQNAYVRIAKNRDGPTGIASLFYFPPLTLFMDPLGNQWQVLPTDDAQQPSSLDLKDDSPMDFDGLEETEMWNSVLEELDFE